MVVFCCAWLLAKGAPKFFTSATFFVYAVHPIFIGALKGVLMPHIPACIPQEITYFALYVLVIVLSYASYFICKRIFPQLTSLLTGARAAKPKTAEK